MTNAPPPPVIYRESEIGHSGAPRLTKAQHQELLRAEQVVGDPRNLHFVFLPGTFHTFVIFNATRGVCADWAGGYEVLNDNPSHRLFYEPGEDPYSVKAAPGA